MRAALTKRSTRTLIAGLLAGDVEHTGIYRELHEQASVVRVFGFWYAVSHTSCGTVLRSKAFGKSNQNRRASDHGARPGSAIPPSVVFMNGMEHQRVRSALVTAMRQFGSERIEQIVADVCSDVVTEVSKRPHPDLVAGFSNDIPIRVISRMLGIDEADRAWLAPVVRTMARTIDPGMSDQDWASAAEAYTQLVEYLRPHLELSRASREHDFLSLLTATGALSQQELETNAILMLIAGYETTQNLLANSVCAVAENAEIRQTLLSEPEYWPNLVEEVLRLHPPVHAATRVALRDVELGGHTIEEGSTVIALIGAANRDPGALEQPETLSLRRANSPHLSFAPGGHYCIGANLARVEAAGGVRMLFERLPDLFLDEPVRRSESFIFRNISSLRVRTGV